MELELVKMSPKGQLVVPLEIRKIESFKEGDRFIPFPVKEGVLFKKVKIPDIKMEFDNLSKDVESQFNKLNVSSNDISKAIKWARKK